jgi:hypothetical protein
LVPSETKVKISIVPAVVVTTGVPALLYLTPVNVAEPLPVDAACLSIKIKDLPEPTLGMVNTHAVDAVSVAV